MKAIDNPNLRHMNDCIVFPSVGSRPITNMCSGSDLDGDLYFVTWESSLMPERMHPPMDYESQKPKIHPRPIEISDIITFFVDFIRNDQLGRIANAHLALSDQSPEGVKDKKCVHLAKLFSLAVDFPKTGIVAQLPQEISKNLTYPDFMEKRDQLNTYESQKIIGKMYRKCKSILFELNNHSKSEFEADRIELNPSLLVEGYEAYLDEAEDAYLNYRAQIERLMSLFSCKNESELFVGIYMTSSHSQEAKDLYKLGSLELDSLWKHMRKHYFSNFKNKDDRLRKECYARKASAWYYVCYTSELNRTRCKILSFPWILEEYFYNEILFNLENYDIFMHSLREKFLIDTKSYQFKSRFVERVQLKDRLGYILNKNLLIVGSYGLFLFENSISDMQIQILDRDEKILNKAKTLLMKHFDFSDLKIKNNVLTCLIDEETSFSLSSFNEAVAKRFLFLRKSIFNKPCILPLLYSFVHFMRQDKLLIGLKNDNIKTETLLIYMLNYLQRTGYIKEDDVAKEKDVEADLEKLFENEDESYELSDSFHIWTNLVFSELENGETNIEIGKALLEFYREHAFNSNDETLKIDLKFDEKKSIDLTNESLQLFHKHCLKVFNFISKVNDIKSVWNVSLEDRAYDNGSTDELSSSFKRRFILSKRKKSKSNNFFVEGASLLQFSNFRSQLDQLEIELYKGERRSSHLHLQCYLPKLSSSLIRSNFGLFTKNCYSEYYFHSMRQLNKAKEMQANEFMFRYQIKFGNAYLINVPDSILDSSGDDTNTYLYKLHEALKKGYRKFNFSYYDSQINETSNQKRNKFFF